MEANSKIEAVTTWPTRVKDYIGDLRAEMSRVTWPTWKQVRATTGVVIIAVFAFGAYFYVIDHIVGKVITKIFETFTK